MQVRYGFRDCPAPVTSRCCQGLPSALERIAKNEHASCRNPGVNTVHSSIQARLLMELQDKLSDSTAAVCSLCSVGRVLTSTVPQKAATSRAYI